MHNKVQIRERKQREHMEEAREQRSKKSQSAGNIHTSYERTVWGERMSGSEKESE